MNSSEVVVKVEKQTRRHSHKGNRPSIPQTKSCPICFAKFTRNTHLTRHLRTHSNERLHRCDICLSQFTRSDLLSRHKRSCGDLLNKGKSRRKSCEACAESKIRCDLKHPCSKCTSRGRDCVFVNDPETSREKKAAAAARRQKKLLDNLEEEDEERESGESPQTPSTSNISPSNDSVTDFYEGSPRSAGSASTPPSAIDYPNYTAAHTMTLSYTHTPTGSASVSPTLFPQSVESSEAANLRAFDDFTAKVDYVETPYQASLDDSHRLSTSHQDVHLMKFGQFLFTNSPPPNKDVLSIGPTGWDVRLSDIAPMTGVTPSHDYLNHAGMSPDSSLVLPNPLSLDASIPRPTGSMNTLDEPTETELRHYLITFFTSFSPHVPIVHHPTWRLEDSPPVLIRAMQACGALFTKTPQANEFAVRTLTATREALLEEDTRHSPFELREEFYLVISVLLVQSIGMFHQRFEDRESSNIYHRIIVSMIRRRQLIADCSSWTPPDLSDTYTLEAAWQEWRVHEMVKRGLIVSYVHDVVHCVFFSLAPAYEMDELNICLPVEDELWRASSAQEWYLLLQQPSRYGSIPARLSGFNMCKALAMLATSSSAVLPVPPFANFVLVHAILRLIFDRATVRNAATEGEFALHIQVLLQSWLHNWMNAPDGPQTQSHSDEPPFMQHATPYYYLAQASLMPFQDGMPAIGGPHSAQSYSPEVRYRVLTQWLYCVRAFLKTGGQWQGPTTYAFLKDLVTMGRQEIVDSQGVGVAVALDGEDIRSSHNVSEALNRSSFVRAS